MDSHPSPHWRTWTKVIGAALLLGATLWLGRAFGHHLPALEDWIAAQGAWGYAAFVVALVACTSIFVPDTVFAVAAGALFGVLGGSAVMIVGCFLTASLNYLLGRMFFGRLVSDLLARKPHLAAIQRAVAREGFRFQFLLRLTPVNPVTVSYVLGATSVPFATFLAACAGLAPSLFVEVYFGYVAKHVASVSSGMHQHSTSETALTIAGLIVCVLLLIYVVRLARVAIARADAADSPRV